MSGTKDLDARLSGLGLSDRFGGGESGTAADTAKLLLASLEELEVEEERRVRSDTAACDDVVSLQQKLELSLRQLELQKEAALAHLHIEREHLRGSEHQLASNRRGHARVDSKGAPQQCSVGGAAQLSSSFPGSSPSAGFRNRSENGSLGGSWQDSPKTHTRVKPSSAGAAWPASPSRVSRGCRGNGSPVSSSPFRRSHVAQAPQEAVAAHPDQNTASSPALLLEALGASSGSSRSTRAAPPPRCFQAPFGTVSSPRVQPLREASAGRKARSVSQGPSEVPPADRGNRGTPLRASRQVKCPVASRAKTRPESRQKTRPSAESTGRNANEAAASEELACAFDVLESAEVLRAKLAAMPEHLRQPVLRSCSGLRGLLEQLPATEMTSGGGE